MKIASSAVGNIALAQNRSKIGFTSEKSSPKETKKYNEPVVARSESGEFRVFPTTKDAMLALGIQTSHPYRCNKADAFSDGYSFVKVEDIENSDKVSDNTKDE